MTEHAPVRARLSAVCPAWVPDAARNYLIHTEIGLSIRALARTEGCHASTVLRQVRRIEQRREDPLMDAGLRRLGQMFFAPVMKHLRTGDLKMGVQVEIDRDSPETRQIMSDCLVALRRLDEPGAVLAVAEEMEKSVIVRELANGESLRTAVVGRDVAEALAVREWIVPKGPTTGRIVRYALGQSGRAILRNGTAAANRAIEDADDDRRYAFAESPLTSLSRRRDKDGNPFLGPTLVRAGERLNEDYELAELDEGTLAEWFSYLSGEAPQPPFPEGDPKRDPELRFLSAVAALGPGLGDAAVRSCCLGEGMEQIEQKMGWSARSGKIVLRIALTRLEQHYRAAFGAHGPMIY